MGSDSLDPGAGGTLATGGAANGGGIGGTITGTSAGCSSSGVVTPDEAVPAVECDAAPGQDGRQDSNGAHPDAAATKSEAKRS